MHQKIHHPSKEEHPDTYVMLQEILQWSMQNELMSRYHAIGKISSFVRMKLVNGMMNIEVNTNHADFYEDMKKVDDAMFSEETKAYYSVSPALPGTDTRMQRRK